MAWGETAAWLEGKENERNYQRLLDDARDAPTRNARRKKIVRPSEMPWEMSRQGLLKHLMNESMNTRVETMDAYMQIIPPGSHSGKHRHLAEECVYVIEGKGYDIHQDCDVEINDVFEWKPKKETQKLEWEAGDYIYIPPMTIHQHFNSDPAKPVRLISCTARIFRQMGLNTLDQLEDAPEFDPYVTLNADVIREYLRGGKSYTTCPDA